MKFYSLPIILIAFLLVINTVTESCGDVEESSSNESSSEEEDSCTCNQPPLCKDNEVYSNCTNGGCDARNCSQLGRPVPCIKLDPANCIEGCVCKTGYLRADNGTCIPSDQCPNCGGDPNAQSGCSFNCGRHCSNYKNKNPICPLKPCRQTDCECKPAYVYDDNIERCVLPQDCTPQCGIHEVYSNCSRIGCQPKKCSEVGLPIPCDPISCVHECVCESGYLRADNGTCIPSDQCPPRCPPNEIYSNCSNGICRLKYCTQYGSPIPFCPKFNMSNCKGGCICNNQYLRNPQGVCVPQEECPKYLCSGNEIYSNCTNGGCDARNCSQLGGRVPCVTVDPANCNRGCVCKTGYLRVDNGTCVPKDECPSPCKGNEVYSSCANGICRPQECKDRGKFIPCPPMVPGSCIGGCICPAKYLRKDGVCVPEEECGVGGTCPADQEYSACPDTLCDPLTCDEVGVSKPNCGYKPTCPGKPACICKNQKVKDREGNCVAQNECQYLCSENEVYSNCTNGGCDARNCTQVGKPVPCVKLDPANCKRGCVCKTGYLRADNGTCIPSNQCPPICQQNEVYSNCSNAICPIKLCTEYGRIILCPRFDMSNCRGGCICKNKYLRNPQGVCVPQDQCPQYLCSENEVYSNCTNGGCDARNCSQVGKPVPCVKLDPANCIRGCVCKTGYLRADNGTCVPRNECPPKCQQNEEYSNCSNGICRLQNCTQYGYPIPFCPRFNISNCKGGCICKNNYLRNPYGACVPQDQCPKYLCSDNEVYSNCTNGGCDARNCSQLGRPVPCVRLDPANCRRGCICKTGYLRADNGTCVPKNKCPPRCQQNEIYSECSNGICGLKNCTQYGDPLPFCPRFDKCKCKGGCICKNTYLRNPEGVCVPQEQCRKYLCSGNEVYSNCTNGGCDARNCSQLGRPVPCKKLDPASCKRGCICVKGYLRAANGTCIPSSQCCNTCGKNERLVKCPETLCIPLSCKQVGRPIPCPIVGPDGPCNKPAECICIDGYLRNDKGVCVPYQQCSKPKEHEVWSPCGDFGCEKRNCTQIDQPDICIDPIKCVGGYVCETGYLRARNGTCIPRDRCYDDLCSKPNEYYDPCPSSCPARTCGIDDRLVRCVAPLKPGDPDCPQPACRCESGYFRDKKGNCVPWEQCHNLCSKPNEYYDPCPSSCPARTCGIDDRLVLCTAPLKPGNPKCPQPSCRCNIGYFRDNKGNCVPWGQCQPVCKVNEVYSSCPAASCVPQDCKDKGKPVPCPRLKPEACIPGCICRDKYLRKNGVCVPEDQCEDKTPTCPCGEVYNRYPPIKCDAEYCPKNRYSPQTCAGPKNCSQGRCVCGFNQKRDRKTGKCIPILKCPPFQCNKPNEVYESCPPVCPGQTCDDYLKNATCPKYHIGIVVPCKPACRCKEGYYRDSKGNCVTGQKCKDQTKCGCSQTPQQPSNNTCADVENLRSALIQGNNLLAMNLLRQEMKENPDKSTISCAYLVMATLAQLALRSNGTTLNELLKIQNLQNKDQIRCAYKGFSERFQTTGDTELDLAYKIYVSSQYNITNAFQKDAVDLFDSEVGSVDFSQNVEAANEINKWVSDKTKGKIEDLVSPAMFDSYTRLVLTNAAYFKGKWKTAFDNETKPTDFHVNPNKTIKVDMMHVRTRMGYSDNEDLNSKIVQFDFNNGNATLIVVVPNDLYGLSAVLDKVVENPTLLNTALNNIQTATVTLYLPKSDISSSIDLKRVMKSIGVNKIFDADAKLRGMIEPDQDLYVSDFVMKATSSINQTGAVAAAASAAVIRNRALPAPPQQQLVVKADRPFLYCIGTKYTPDNFQVLFSALFSG